MAIKRQREDGPSSEVLIPGMRWLLYATGPNSPSVQILESQLESARFMCLWSEGRYSDNSRELENMHRRFRNIDKMVMKQIPKCNGKMGLPPVFPSLDSLRCRNKQEKLLKSQDEENQGFLEF